MAYLPEYEDWRLVVSGRQLDAVDRLKAYRLLHDTLGAVGFTVDNTPPMLILSMSDPFIKGLRRLFGKARNVEGMRLGNQLIGDRFLDDAFVYKIS